MGESNVDPNLQGILWAAGASLAGWVIKEVNSIKPLKENVNEIRTKVDALHNHFLQKGLDDSE